MKKITETDIQEVLESIGQNNQDSAQLMAQVYEKHSVLFNYLESSYASVFNTEESQYVEFASFVILAAAAHVNAEDIDLNDLIASDEDTLALLEKDKSFDLENHLNTVYDNVLQKDLLEFVIEYIYEEETAFSNLSKDLMASFLHALLQAIEIGAVDSED